MNIPARLSPQYASRNIPTGPVTVTWMDGHTETYTGEVIVTDTTIIVVTDEAKILNIPFASVRMFESSQR